MYVVSVVPNVPALLAEMQRICKPGGRIAIINHFAHPNPLVYQMERVLENFASLLGFHTTLPLENVTRTPGLNILRIQQVNWFGYWTLILAENDK
jgi:phosphatidylethanolamine/phosphatidyl-N-methylethanolamine N-methyltransferase